MAAAGVAQFLVKRGLREIGALGCALEVIIGRLVWRYDLAINAALLSTRAIFGAANATAAHAAPWSSCSAARLICR